ncbi:hypothetical protein QEN19_004278 [Hanseniaspora menglaensis]
MDSKVNLFLNSTSPRRKDILVKILSLIDPSIEIGIIKPTFAEDLDKNVFSTSKDYLLENTRMKCDAGVLSTALNESISGYPIIIISADTILTNSTYTRVLEKPTDEKHNYQMLQEQLEDGSIICMTSVQITLMKNSLIVKQDQFLQEAKIVLDNSLLNRKKSSIDLIQNYVNTGEGLDAAGGFKIQEKGSFMVKEIDGDFYTVVGLPFNSTLISLTDIISSL